MLKRHNLVHLRPCVKRTLKLEFATLHFNKTVFRNCSMQSIRHFQKVESSSNTILQATMKMQSRNLPENSKRTSSQLQYSQAWEVQRFDSLEGNITCDCSPSVQKRQLLQRFLRSMFCCLKGIPPCSSMQSISCYRQTMAVWSEWSSTYSQT